jgi:hypothetical protein
MNTNNKLRIVEIRRGRCVLREGAKVPQCYVCNQPASAWPWPDGPRFTAHGFALINDGASVLLCEACFGADGTTADSIVRKFLNAPDLTVVSTARVVTALTE